MTQLKKNIYFVAIGQVSQKLLAFLLIPFAARGLGDAGFGRFSLASTLMFLVVLLNDWGMNTYVTREIARQKEKFPVLFCNTLALKSLLILFNFGILILYLKTAGYDVETDRAILIFAGYGIISSFIQLAVAVFEAFERMQYEAIILTLEKIIITAAGLYVLSRGYGLVIFCAVFGLGGLVSLAVSFLMIKIYFPLSRGAVSFQKMKDIFINSLPFGFSLIFATIYNTTGIFLLSLQQTAKEVGWFSAGFKLISISNLIPLVLVGAIYPALSAEMNRNRSERVQPILTQGMKFLYFLALPMITGGMMLSDKLIPFIFGEEFRPAIQVLRIMVWTAALVFFNLYFTGVLKAANLQKTMARLQGIALLINIAVNIILISLDSYRGAAWATVFTEAFIFAAYLRVIRTRICRIAISDFWMKGLIGTLALILILYCLRSFHVVGSIGLGMAFYVILLYLIKGFRISEILPFARHEGGEA